MDDDANSNEPKKQSKSSSADDWAPVETRRAFSAEEKKDKTQNK